MESFSTTCPRGLESALERELSALGAQRTEAKPGDVAFAGDLVLAMRANLESRVASRVLWRVGAGDYTTVNDIYAGARCLPWSDWFGPERTIRVDVAAIRSPLRSLDFATCASRTRSSSADSARAAARPRCARIWRPAFSCFWAGTPGRRYSIPCAAAGRSLSRRPRCLFCVRRA